MDNNNSYLGVCTTASNKSGIADLISNIETTSDITVSCFDSEKTYVVSSPLKSDSKISFCTDSTSYIGNGTANSSTFSCDKNATNEISSSTQNIQTQSSTSSIYTYSLSTGWQKLPNNTENVEAVNQTTGFNFILKSASLPASASTVTSIDEIVKLSDSNTIVQRQFPGATLIDSKYLSIGGEKAIAITLKYPASKTDLFVSEYITLHGKLEYIMIFSSAYSQKGIATGDFQTIINSFKFTANL